MEIRAEGNISREDFGLAQEHLMKIVKTALQEQKTTLLSYVDNRFGYWSHNRFF